MKVLNLCCSQDHRFEGWFASEADYASQIDRGLLVCPVCEDTAVSRLPSAPRLSTARARSGDAPPAGPAEPEVQRIQAEWMRRVRRLIEATENVGERFATEARRIHYGETEERAIRGRATREEAVALHDEGIEVMTLPLPSALKEPLQ